jgi:glutamate-5-semialdehyde dehydrogenase
MFETILPRLEAARRAARTMAAAPAGLRSQALMAIAQGLRNASSNLLAANADDVARATASAMDPAFVDRLTLTPERILEMAAAIDEIAAAPDPVGRIESEQIRPNGLRVARMRIPLGVVGVIYESRPNVTSDAAALAIRSGNAVVLRGGSDARESNRAIGLVIEQAIIATGLPPASVTLLTEEGREQMRQLLTASELVDVIIPRGGEGLIRFVREHSRVPVISHYKGVCHVYVDAHADLQIARRVAVSAKVSRVSACNSAETLLVHQAVAPTILPLLAADFLEQGVRLHVCPRTRELLGPHELITDATDAD